MIKKTAIAFVLLLFAILFYGIGNMWLFVPILYLGVLFIECSET